MQNPSKVNDGKAEAGMNRKRKNEKKTIGLAALLVASQLFQVANVSADSQEYSGVTQIASEDVCLDVNDLAVLLCQSQGAESQQQDGGQQQHRQTGESFVTLHGRRPPFLFLPQARLRVPPAAYPKDGPPA